MQHKVPGLAREGAELAQRTLEELEQGGFLPGLGSTVQAVRRCFERSVAGGTPLPNRARRAVQLLAKAERALSQNQNADSAIEEAATALHEAIITVERNQSPWGERLESGQG